MLEVEYFWNGWAEKDGVNVNLVKCDWLNLNTPMILPSHLTVFISFKIENTIVGPILIASLYDNNNILISDQ